MTRKRYLAASLSPLPHITATSMKKRTMLSLLPVLLLGLVSMSAQAQDWEYYQSEKFDIQFAVPTSWSTTVDGDYLVSAGDGIVFVLGSVKDNTIDMGELFNMQVETLGFDSEGEYEELELPSGMYAIMGYGAGAIQNQLVGMILLSTNWGDNNYFAYIYTDPDKIEYYENVMVDIITSIGPLDWE